LIDEFLRSPRCPDDPITSAATDRTIDLRGSVGPVALRSNFGHCGKPPTQFPSTRIYQGNPTRSGPTSQSIVNPGNLSNYLRVGGPLRSWALTFAEAPW
jgi:hypothetical protein